MSDMIAAAGYTRCCIYMHTRLPNWEIRRQLGDFWSC